MLILFFLIETDFQDIKILLQAVDHMLVSFNVDKPRALK